MEGYIGTIPSTSYSSICTTSESEISWAQAHFIIYRASEQNRGYPRPVGGWT